MPSILLRASLALSHSILPSTVLYQYYYCLYFLDKETEAQGFWVTCPRLQSKLVLDLWILNSGSSLFSKDPAPNHNAILLCSKRKSLDKMTSKGLSSSNILWLAVPFLDTWWTNQLILKKKERRTVFSHLKSCHVSGRLDLWTGLMWGHYREAAYIRESSLASIQLVVGVCREAMTPLSWNWHKAALDKHLSEVLHWVGMELNGLKLGVGIKWDHIL